MTQQPVLTQRQAQVAELIGDGLSYKAVAARLGIGGDRVKQHVDAIAMKVWMPDDGTLDPRDVVFLYVRHQRWERSHRLVVHSLRG